MARSASGRPSARSSANAPSSGLIDYDREKYKWRHLVENFFCQIKAFRRIGTRYEKTDKGFAAMIYLAATVLWTK